MRGQLFSNKRILHLGLMFTYKELARGLVLIMYCWLGSSVSLGLLLLRFRFKICLELGSLELGLVLFGFSLLIIVSKSRFCH